MGKINVKKIGTTEEFVYDISLEGTVVNALGCNINSNTDGFNFQMPDNEHFRYTDEHPYISTGEGRNTVKGKAYTKVNADVAEFEDLFLSKAYDGGINKMGLGIDEFCDACIQFSRKNYADLMPDGSTKKVGNTIKSRKMSGYLERFIDMGVDLLLRGKGHEFLENYYEYIDNIYNYRIPIKEIASKGKIKKTIAEYKEDCKTVTKAGNKKARQAWYELVMKDGINADVGDTIYYINTGTKKAHSDVKRITHKFVIQDGVETELNTKLAKELILPDCEKEGIDIKSVKTAALKKMVSKYVVREEDEIILNCKLVPNEIVNSEGDVLCSDVDDMEYNVEKYIDQFNKRITPLLVCFSPEIRDKIIITKPSDRQYFTEEESKLVSGFPNKPGDQDTYEALMTPENKEIEFWLKINERPPFIDECGIKWDELVEKYIEEKKKEDTELFKIEDEKYLEALNSLTNKDIEDFENEGIIPKQLSDIVTMDSNMYFYFKKLPDVRPSTGGFVFDDIRIPEFETIET